MSEIRPDRFWGEFTSVALPQCNKCAHYNYDNSCTAFVVIPREIIPNQHNHRLPYPGDNGIQFEPIDEGKDNGQHRNQRR